MTPLTPNALCLIPARLASTRLPGKPLLAETGKPLIQHVVENARRAQLVRDVVVATDAQSIFDAVTAFGGHCVMTGDHPNGTSRLAEAVAKVEPDAAPDSLIVNLQGDEHEIDPTVIDALIQGLANDPDAPMATLRSPFASDEDRDDPNIVKVACTYSAPAALNSPNAPPAIRALYFSRSLIPHDRDRNSEHTPVVYKHPGLYAYRRHFLDVYPTMTPTPLEQAEKLEQLRVLEHGHTIAIVEAQAPRPGIDTPEQYAAFVKRLSESN